MSYQQQGYPQQQPQQPPRMGGYQSGGYPAADSPSPAVAVIAGILGLVATAGLIVATVKSMSLFSDLGLSFGDLPGKVKTLLILGFAAAAVLLIGAIVVFLRKLAGAIILVIGGLAGIAAVVMYPVLLPGGDFGEFFKEMFKFPDAQATFLVVALIASPLTLIAAILPPTLNYLKGSRSDVDSGFGTPPQGYPQQGYGQQGQQQGW
jgi:hypothetical protein